MTIKLINETGNLNDTAPLDASGERYVGPNVDQKTGKLICPKCGKSYEECKCDNPENTVHSKNIPDDLQGIKMGNVSDEKKEAVMDFFDGLDDLLLEEFRTKKVDEASTKTSSDTASKTSTKTATKTSTDAYTQGNVTVTGGAGAGATSVTISIPRGDGGDPAKTAGDAKPEKKLKGKSVEESMKNPTPEEIVKAKTFSESFKNYMERNGERIDRKPSDVGTKPNTTMKNLYYQDHFLPKNIH
jgi:uncharacterized Zn finger protein (UPF0148 family)